jgi:hypothetical protein
MCVACTLDTLSLMGLRYWAQHLSAQFPLLTDLLCTQLYCTTATYCVFALNIYGKIKVNGRNVTAETLWLA